LLAFFASRGVGAQITARKRASVWGRRKRLTDAEGDRLRETSVSITAS